MRYSIFLCHRRNCIFVVGNTVLLAIIAISKSVNLSVSEIAYSAQKCLFRRNGATAIPPNFSCCNILKYKGLRLRATALPHVRPCG